MPRKKTFQTFREAQKLGAFAEMPMLPSEIQVQVQLSRNDRPQPFFALYAQDTLLLLMSGEGSVEFRGTSVHSFPLAPGDCVYVPAGAAHRLVHKEESVVLRFVPQSPLVEGVAWYCGSCGRELYREVWNTADRLSQDAYGAACARFSASEERRLCPSCKHLHPPVDAAPFHWDAVAEFARAP
jgi:mannose-6-phosphate isomerase-like protein (cupin superfamily)